MRAWTRILISSWLACTVADSFAMADEAWNTRWPQPVRLTQHQEPVVSQSAAQQAVTPRSVAGQPNAGPPIDAESTALEGATTTDGPSESVRQLAPLTIRPWAPSPHNVLRPPEPLPNPRAPKPHPTWEQLHRVKRSVGATPPRIPQARERGTWKTPYSYGYFGAGSKRHWSVHHGYQDNATTWRLR
ncbi:MAG: hypothetical protein AAGA03_20240 [Planctomycetota bacterium]